MKTKWHLFVIACCLIPTVAAFGASILPLDFEELVRHSQTVVVGEIVDKHSAWTEDSTTIYTYYSISIDPLEKDQRTDSITELRAAGGWVGETGIDVPGIPAFDLHDQVLLFLSSPPSKYFPVVGWERGVFHLVGERGSLERAVFTHDWRPIVGLDSTGIQVKPPAGLADQSISELRSVTLHERKQASTQQASKCIRLKTLLGRIDSIAKSHRKSNEPSLHE